MSSCAIRSLYIHWPFCPYKCHFCPFVALASQDHLMHDYHHALMREIGEVTTLFKERQQLDTIFLGGGTPSTYPDALLLDTFDTLRKSFIFDEASEVTIEVNPGTVRKEQYVLWKSLGINRLSIGVQSMKDQVLKNLNRHQKAADVLAVLDEARHYFQALSVDLILGLPGVSSQEWKELIKCVVSWPIVHISVYFLTVHEETPLYFKVQKKSVVLACDDEMIDLYYWTCQMLADNGFEQYELSNFARSGYESRHNQAYWEREPYYGFGLGACGFDGLSRTQNEKNIKRYIDLTMERKSPVVWSEKLTPAQERLEILMLGLRHRSGVSQEMILRGLDDAASNRVLVTIDALCKDGFMQDDGGYFRLTPRGLVVENEVITRLSL